MKNSKLIQLYAAFSKKELKEFGDFVRSPFYNKHKRTVQLHKILAGHHPIFESDQLNKAALYQLIFARDQLNEQKINDLMSYLLKLGERYLVIKNIEQHGSLAKQCLIDELGQRGLEKSFNQYIKTAGSSEESMPFEDDETYLNQYHLAKFKDTYFSKKDLRSFDEALQEKVDALDRFYLTEKLRSSCEMINRQNIIQANYQFNMLNEVMNLIEHHRDLLNDHPPIMIYYTILLTLKNPENENAYTDLMQLLEKHSGLFSNLEASNMYAYAENFCIKKINSGKSGYLKELFGLYQTLLEKKLNLIDGVLSQWDYKNIVTVGCRLHEYEWVLQFIHSYKDHLPEEIRENAFHYNLAAYLYEKGSLEESISVLQSVEFTDVYYSLGGRSMLLKIYYELEEYDPLFSLIEAFKMYLRRNKKISKYQYTAHMNLLRFTSKLTKVRLLQVSARKATIEKQLALLKEKMKPNLEITNVQWLKEKIGELENAVQPVKALR